MVGIILTLVLVMLFLDSFTRSDFEFKDDCLDKIEFAIIEML